ncbi:MAG: deoxyribodipyrimidine photo-lyase [Rhodobacteraceae bacterium]|nr:deoxyribodipyrimidine photo-lyase [Paracoccaceae bacterium]
MNKQSANVILWFRRDLRLRDHPALAAACATGRPVIPVCILDPETEALGAAPKWRWGQGVARFAETLAAHGAQLMLQRGAALEVLQSLVAETGARDVYWSRLYDPASVARDTAVKSALKAKGIVARSFPGHLMYEPWTARTKTGGFYKAYTPFWKSRRLHPVDPLVPAPVRIPAPDTWPVSERLADWHLDCAMRRGGPVLAAHARVGERAAQARLDWFVDKRLSSYAVLRDVPAEDGTSGLSEHLALGELSPRRCWWAAGRLFDAGSAGAETFRKELVWREFAYHLMHHTPHIITRNWKPDWDRFPWNSDATHPHVLAWKQGRTGIEFVDAAMRELYVTGRMHNRARMIVASYLTKHLLTHWQIGQAWFDTRLTDWDPANNAMGWQWSAGSGPDAAPYFRVFNPVTQLNKFDKDRRYTRHWLAETVSNPSDDALSFFDAAPPQWGLKPTDAYPNPIITAEDGRKRALQAYESRGF